MSDLRELVNAIKSAAPDAPFRIRQGVVQSVQANGTCTIAIGGSTTAVAGISYASTICPIPGKSVWLATDGRDWFVMATMAPNGNAYGAMRQSVAQSIATTAFTELDWTNRTDTTANGITLGANGFTCIVPGLYQVNFGAVLAANNTGQRHAYIVHNGTNEFAGFSTNAPGTGDLCRINVHVMLKLAAGDTVNGVVYQSSGAALNTQIGSGANILRAVWICATP